MFWFACALIVAVLPVARWWFEGRRRAARTEAVQRIIPVGGDGPTFDVALALAARVQQVHPSAVAVTVRNGRIHWRGLDSEGSVGDAVVSVADVVAAAAQAVPTADVLVVDVAGVEPTTHLLLADRGRRAPLAVVLSLGEHIEAGLALAQALCPQRGVIVTAEREPSRLDRLCQIARHRSSHVVVAEADSGATELTVAHVADTAARILGLLPEATTSTDEQPTLVRHGRSTRRRWLASRLTAQRSARRARAGV